MNSKEQINTVSENSLDNNDIVKDQFIMSAEESKDNVLQETNKNISDNESEMSWEWYDNDFLIL